MDYEMLLNGEEIKVDGFTFYLTTEDIVLGKKDGEYILNYVGTDFKAIKEVYNELINRNIKVCNIKIILSKYKDKYDLDYSELLSLSDIVVIKYGIDYDVCASLDEFIKYKEYINNFKNKYFNKSLSPVEKLMISYDFVKSMEYKMTDDNSQNGLPHLVINGNGIVCRGYCLLLNELLCDDDNIDISDISFNVYDKKGELVDYHDRNIVIIDDEKYKIHGAYFLDPTNDSYKEEYKDYFGDDYKKGDLYRFFLLPLNYPEIYSDDDYEYRISNMQTDSELSYTDESFSQEQEKEIINILYNSKEDISFFLDSGLNGIFGDKSIEQIRSYVLKDRVDFNLFMTIVYNVRQILGYSKELCDIEVSRISRINSEFYYISSNMKNRD